jgi:predicted Zn-dependent protease with MMP-like domain
MRGRLAPGELDERLGLRRAVPLARSRAEQFDDLVLDAVEQLEERWAGELAGVEVAVEDVPPLPSSESTYDPNVVTDSDVPLARLVQAAGNGRGGGTPARIVVYRRPLEARSADRTELADIVLDVVVEEVAQLLGIDPDEVDPPGA